MLLSLQAIQLDAPLNASGECLVLTELVLPRNAIARKAALKDVHLSKGKRSFARAPFYEKALLKEKVDGLFGIKVSVTRPLKHPELQKFLRQLIATGIESSTDLLSPLFIRYLPPALSRSNVLGDLLEEASDQLTDSITDSSPAFLATGGLDLDSASLTAGKISVPLKLTETIRKSDLPPGPKSREKRKTTAKFHKKGALVGEVSFDLSVD
jgi:hypothetical protein